MSRILGQGGSSLFMFTITKQFDQRNNDKCQLAQIAKVQLELHRRHPSLRVGLRDIFILRNAPSHGAENPHLRAKPSTVMAAPEPLSRFFYILPEILLSGKFYIHTEKTGNIAGFPYQFNSSKCKQQFIIFSNNISRVSVW